MHIQESWVCSLVQSRLLIWNQRPTHSQESSVCCCAPSSALRHSLSQETQQWGAGSKDTTAELPAFAYSICEKKKKKKKKVEVLFHLELTEFLKYLKLFTSGNLSLSHGTLFTQLSQSKLSIPLLWWWAKTELHLDSHFSKEGCLDKVTHPSCHNLRPSWA